jgi:predicted alpha/beta superfamily hydrolase
LEEVEWRCFARTGGRMPAIRPARTTQPETFNGNIIGSPSIWWADEAVLKLAEAYTTTHSDLRPDVFLGVGRLEEIGPAVSSRMVTNVLRLATMLRAKKYPRLN